MPLRRNTEKAADKKRMNPRAKLSRGNHKRSENLAPRKRKIKKNLITANQVKHIRDGTLPIRTGDQTDDEETPEVPASPCCHPPSGASVTGEAWTRPGVKVKTGTRRT